MRIGVPAESYDGETRVAATPETIKKLIKDGHQVCVAKDAGKQASLTDEAFVEAGASMCDNQQALACELVLKVRAPTEDEIKYLKPKSIVLGMLNPFDKEGLERLAAADITSFALEAAPRTSRAQSLDVLSSQANIGGYKAVILAADAYKKFFPMLMTAAGTVKAARVVVLGVGVAGLQAIATAKRLGAVIEASDVRPSVKEQIESLGGKFIDVPYETDEEREAAEGRGGYAKAMPKSWLDRQQIEVAKRIAKADVVISTALIPGRDAPTLISEDMVKSMQSGSVIVDMAAGRGSQNEDGHRGGNCPLTEADKTVNKHNITIIGHTNLPALVASDASALYARNILNFLKLALDKEEGFKIDMQDDIIAACLMTKDGKLVDKTKA